MDACLKATCLPSRLVHNLGAIALSGHLPSRRALAAMVKLCGRRLERRWPFLPKAEGKDLNLGFQDFLELQYARSREFTALVIGAFDGMANDPTGEFIRRRRCRAVFVEPQPGPFNRLREHMGSCQNVMLLNAAVDEVSGVHDMYCIPPGIEGLPGWTEQLASFQKDHLLKHEDRAPGLSQHIQALQVPTISFNDLLDRYGLKGLDVLQIDAEGMDAQLLAWFPFERIKPAVLHYETAHMTSHEQSRVRQRLSGLGYTLRVSDCPTDDMAICF
jgi:FkbM family methyltransferase